MKRIISIFWALAALESAAALIYLASIPADIKNAVILGLSAQRLIMVAFVAIAMMVFGSFFFRGEFFLSKAFTSTLKSQRRLFIFFVLLATIGWQLSFLAGDQLGIYLAYYLRLQPLILWATVLFLQTSILFVLARLIRQPASEGKIQPNSPFFKAFAFSLLGFLGFWLIVLVTGLGIGTGNNFWNKVGVPLLGIQIVAAVLLGLVVLFLEERILKPKFIKNNSWLVDAILIVLIWSAAAIWWSNTAMASSRFNSQLFPPNYASYPFSDAMEYDLNAQRIMQGNGMIYSYADKAFHIVFLTLLHVFAGQDFNQVTLLQTIMLAIMPPLLYLLGKSFVNRPVGVMVAILDIFYQLNAIQANNLIQVSNVKMMLSEPLTRTAVIFICLLAVRWLRNPGRWWENLMLVAGVTGLCSIIRLNIAFILPVIILFAAVQMKWKWRKVFPSAAVVVVFFIIALSPWAARNAVVVENPILFMKSKIVGVIWRERLNPMMQVNPTVPPQPSSGAVTGATPEPVSPDMGETDDDQGGIAALVWPIASNYAHNLIASFLMIPPVLEQGGILHIIREPYWDNEWSGRFTQGGMALLLGNLAIISLGVAGAWRRRNLAGVFPLLVFLMYHVTNAVSAVSGGRYIVPVDWVLPFYFMIGIAETILFVLHRFAVRIFQPAPAPPIDAFDIRFRWKRGVPILGIVLLLGAIPWTVESIFPASFPRRSQEEILRMLDRHADWEASDFSMKDVAIFLENPQAVLMEGQIFYPRHFQPGQGDTASSDSPFGVRSYPHLGFVLQGGSRADVDLYIEQPPSTLENATEAIVLGCMEGEHVNAGMVMVTSSPSQTILRTDLRNLTCPLAGLK